MVERPATVTSYVSKATCKKAILRSIRALAIIRAGDVRAADGERYGLMRLLITSPSLRFDTSLEKSEQEHVVRPAILATLE